MIDRFQADSIGDTAWEAGYATLYCVVTDYLRSDPGDGWEVPPDPGAFDYRLEDEDGNEVDVTLDDDDEAALLKEYEAVLAAEDGENRADAIDDGEW